MKRMYKEQKHTLYDISKNTGLSVMTLYKYTKNTSIDNMALGQFLKIAEYEGIEPLELYKRIKEEQGDK